jgi:ankyrin repeat protein
MEQLIRAIHLGDIASVKTLLKQGVNPDVSGPSGSSALILAASVARWETVDLLLQAGANPNAANVSGLTALMWAATQNRDQAVQTLLKAGADPFIEDTEHHNALWHSKHGSVSFTIPFIRGAHATLFGRRIFRTRSGRLITAAMSSRSSGTGQGRSNSH